MTDSEVDTCRTEDTVPPGRSHCLVLRGISPGDTTYVELGSSTVVLGRGAECDVQLDYGRVSRRHAEIRAQGPLHALVDLGSTNGTHVEGERVERSVLEPDMLVRLGDWLGIVEGVDATGPQGCFGELAAGVWGGPTLARSVGPLLRAARSDLPIVLVGATGTGKERFARALHVESRRSGGFHAVNCAALPEALAESELFGHAKGAFTGAERSYTGQLRAADGGTLLLDEVAELPLPLQAKLLRAIEHKEVTPLGQTGTVAFDVRFVAACQRPLTELVARGTIRQDLAMRMSGLTVELPALQERRADIPGLFWNFVRDNAPARTPSVSARLYEALCLCEWPGNVRELELLARRLLATFAHEPTLRRSFLPAALQSTTVRNATSKPPEVGLTQLTDALAKTHGNVRHAAALIGISRQRAYRLITSRRLANVVAAARDGILPEPHDSGDRDS